MNMHCVLSALHPADSICMHRVLSNQCWFQISFLSRFNVLKV